MGSPRIASRHAKGSCIQTHSGAIYRTRHKGKFAMVTGATTGIGYELAKCCAADGFDLLIAADDPEIHQAAEEQTNVHKYLRRLFVITNRLSLSEAASGYCRFKTDKDECIKIVMKPELN